MTISAIPVSSAIRAATAPALQMPLQPESVGSVMFSVICCFLFAEMGMNKSILLFYHKMIDAQSMHLICNGATSTFFRQFLRAPQVL